MRLSELLADSPFQGYSYAYPHKTAYRPLAPAVRLDELWAGERHDALFLYLHVPFCEMRCAFCNLFTQPRPQDDVVNAYLTTLRRHAHQVRAALPDARFARCAIGGGTPTYLDVAGLADMLDIAEGIMGADLRAIPVSVEVSPATVEQAKLELLRRRGVDRISIGVQSFNEAETAQAGRPQPRATVARALDMIRSAGFPTLNIDLIYGLPGQSVASWVESLETALQYAPEELYLYPLYVRPLTGLGKSARHWDDIRPACYHEGVALLHSRGYVQTSMRMFQVRHAATIAGPVYCCQEDGMVGIGCGARSYTRGLHYANEYAVGARGVRSIIAAYVARTDAAFAHAEFGFRLDGTEQRRRYVIQSLLTREGLRFAPYRHLFGTQPVDDLPELNELAAHGLARREADGLCLTEAGLFWSDVIGPWLYSDAVRGLMAAYPLQ
ncbi:coproporphyrinogen III oxidase [Planctomycetaceae bacterium SCGC AG-212-F19]|nr:coproporphyrinogen III oxidase [Planctomycetaceae bacterium SCGC AG-212-F19]